MYQYYQSGCQTHSSEEDKLMWHLYAAGAPRLISLDVKQQLNRYGIKDVQT